MPASNLQMILDEIEHARSVRQENEAAYNEILEQACQQLIRLTADYPDNAEVLYQCASVHDMLGLEREAIPYYEKAISSGTLPEEDLRGAYLGLGSTYRCVGEYEKSISLLSHGMKAFPEDYSLQVFLALAKYNTKDYEGAMQLLLDSLVETSTSEHIRRYSQAIKYYRDRLDQTW